MRDPANLAALLQAFFTTRLMAQRKVSPHTIASYRDTFRLLLQFAQMRWNVEADRRERATGSRSRGPLPTGYGPVSSLRSGVAAGVGSPFNRCPICP